MSVVKSPLSNCHLTPSWKFPCYTLLLTLRPLPTAALRETYPEADDSEDEGLEELEDQFASGLDEEDEDEEEEEESFIDTQEETQRTGSTKRSAKKRKKQRRGSGTNDIDLEPSRHPLSQKFHDNRKQQRIEHHPMPPRKKSGAAPSRKSARVSAADESNRAHDLKDKENQELKEKLAALETQLKLERAASQHGKTTTNDTAMGREVAKIAKKKLWKVCKFITSDASLRKATKYVINCFVMVWICNILTSRFCFY